MGTTFRPYQPDQMLLLPQDLREWVSEGHLAHHVSDLVDALDLGAFYGPYEGDGRRNSPYEPRMMVKVLVHGYATGTFSSRKLARKLEEDIAFRMLAAGNFPQHRTLCEFRRRHLKDFGAVFAEVVRLARTMGLAGLGRVSVDGTKVRANASKRKAMSYGRMAREERRLQAKIRALLKTAEAVDAAEDACYGEEVRGDAQIAVEGENQLVVGAGLTDNASDQGQLLPMVDGVAETCGETPAQVLADAGYCNEPDLQALKERDIDGYVALGREGGTAAAVDADEHPAKARMAEKLESDEGRRRYARRKWMAEAPVGWIKEVMGFRRFSFRGLEKVQGEWTLVCLAPNVKRLHTLQAA